MVDDLGSFDRIDDRGTGDRIETGVLVILIFDRSDLKPVTGPPEPTGGEIAFFGKEMAFAVLLDRLGSQTQQSFVIRDRREHFGVEDQPDLVANVVVHPVGVNDPFALAEDDISFQVHFQRDFVRLGVFSLKIENTLGPEDQAVGRNVDRAETGQPVDDQIDSGGDDPDRLVGVRASRPFDVDRGVAPGENPDTSVADRRFVCLGAWCRDDVEFRVLSPANRAGGARLTSFQSPIVNGWFGFRGA